MFRVLGFSVAGLGLQGLMLCIGRIYRECVKLLACSVAAFGFCLRCFGFFDAAWSSSLSLNPKP